MQSLINLISTLITHGPAIKSVKRISNGPATEDHGVVRQRVYGTYGTRKMIVFSLSLSFEEACFKFLNSVSNNEYVVSINTIGFTQGSL